MYLVMRKFGACEAGNITRTLGVGRNGRLRPNVGISHCGDDSRLATAQSR